MKIKLFLSLLLAGGLVASAQSQGYKDGIEYYNAGQYDNAKDKAVRSTAERAKEKVFMTTGALRVFGEDVELLCRFHLVCP